LPWPPFPASSWRPSCSPPLPLPIWDFSPSGGNRFSARAPLPGRPADLCRGHHLGAPPALRLWRRPHSPDHRGPSAVRLPLPLVRPGGARLRRGLRRHPGGDLRRHLAGTGALHPGRLPLEPTPPVSRTPGGAPFSPKGSVTLPPPLRGKSDDEDSLRRISGSGAHGAPRSPKCVTAKNVSPPWGERRPPETPGACPPRAQNPAPDPLPNASGSATPAAGAPPPHRWK